MIQKILSVLVGLIGLGMIIGWWGAWPPVLSGTAFVIICIKGFL